MTGKDIQQCIGSVKGVKQLRDRETSHAIRGGEETIEREA